MKRNLEFPKFSVLDSLGNPLSGGKVYFYEAGTSTLKDTYSDPEGTTKNSNPVVLDSRGEADIYLDRDPYKIVVKDASDVTIMTRDKYQAYMAADDTPIENLLINADARSNENGYVSGTDVVAGDDIYDAWTCAADGTVTFVAEGDIALSSGTKIQHTNDDMAAMTGETVTVSVQSGSVEIVGFGLTVASVVSVGNPVTFVADGTSALVLGSASSAYTFAGISVVKGNTATNTIRRPYLLEKFLCKDYVATLRQERVNGTGVVSRAHFSTISTSQIELLGGAYRLTTSSKDKIIRLAETAIQVTIDYDQAGVTLPPWGDVAFLYLLDTAADADQPINSASHFRLCVEWTPAYNAAKQGWYYNNHRCIGVFWLDSNSNLMSSCINDNFVGGAPDAISHFASKSFIAAADATVTGSIAIPTECIKMLNIEAKISVAAGGSAQAYLNTDSSYTNNNSWWMSVAGQASGVSIHNSMACEVLLNDTTWYGKIITVSAAGDLYVYVRGYKWDQDI